MLRLLVAEGNTPAGRRRIAETAGATPAEGYAEVLRAIAPDAMVDICTPADEGAATRQRLNSYDGVAITGSALNIYNRDTESLRQIDFVRELFARGIPMFGSCWGLQLAAVAAGGEVKLNPKGARGRICLQNCADGSRSCPSDAQGSRCRLRCAFNPQRRGDAASSRRDRDGSQRPERHPGGGNSPG